MKYLLLLVVFFVGGGASYYWGKKSVVKHTGFCLRCPDSCVVKLTNGLYVYGSDSYKQTIECDCGGGGMVNPKVIDGDVLKDSVVGYSTGDVIYERSGGSWVDQKTLDSLNKTIKKDNPGVTKVHGKRGKIRAVKSGLDIDTIPFSGIRITKAWNFLIANETGEILAARDSVGRWEIYDTLKALEMWYYLDSIKIDKLNIKW